MKTFEQQTIIFGLLIAFQLQPLLSAPAAAPPVVAPPVAGSNPLGALAGSGNPASDLTGSGSPVNTLTGNGGAASGVSNIVSGIGGGSGGPFGFLSSILSGLGGNALSSLLSSILAGGNLTDLLGVLSLGNNNLLGPLKGIFKNVGGLDLLLNVVSQLLKAVLNLLQQLLGGVLDIKNLLPLQNLQLLEQALQTLKSQLNLGGINVDDLCDLNTLVKKVLANTNNANALKGLNDGDLLEALQATTALPVDQLADAGAVADFLNEAGIDVDETQAQIIGDLQLVIQGVNQLRDAAGMPCPAAPAGNPPAGGAGNPPANGAGNPPSGGAGNPPAGGAGNPPAGGAGNPPAGGAGNPLAGGAAPLSGALPLGALQQ